MGTALVHITNREAYDMKTRSLGAGLAVLLAASTLSIGCGHKEEIEKSVARSEDGAKRAEAAASRVEVAAKRAEAAANKVEQLVSHAEMGASGTPRGR